MKKLSLLFIFIMLAVALLAITAFAAQSNLANQAEVSTTTGCWVVANYLSNLTDGNYEKGTASSYSDKAFDFVFNFKQNVYLDEVILVVNGKGRTYDDGKGGGFFETVTDNDFTIAVKMTNLAGEIVYQQSHQTGGKTEIIIATNTQVSEITLSVTCSWNSGLNIWEVETLGHICSYTELKEEIPAPTCMETGTKIWECPECNSTSEEIIPAIGTHTWDEGEITTDPTETTEGVKTFTCSVCQETKTEVVQPVGHNWDEGTVVPPSCENGGYTVYKCTDEGCDASYSKDPTDALEHDYDSVITVAPTLTKEGEQFSTCKRDGCGHSKTETVPVATMADSSFVLGLDNIISVEEIIVGDAHENRDWKTLFDGNNANTTNSQNSPAGWFGLKGSSLTIVFDEEYYVLNADYYAWSNWNGAKIEFFNAAGEKVATYSSNSIQPGSGVATTMTEAANVAVKSIKITIDSAKYTYGEGLAFQEFVITAHKHIAEGETARYDEVIGCMEPGNYKKYCYVCEKEVMVETKPTNEHDNVTDISFPKGFDMNGSIISTCQRCNNEEKHRLKPIFYSHGYSVREDGANGGIAHKVEIDLEALATYESYAGTTLVFGSVAAATPNFDGSPIEIVDGQVVATSDKVSVKALFGLGYAFIEDRISNIPEFAFDTGIVLCPYIYDGKSISYINATIDSGAAFETVTYNELLSE